jgi:hypothetical protein
MRTFKDNAGRTWTVTVNVDAVKRVRSLLDVNLLEVVDGHLIERLAADPVLLCDVIYALVKPEADAQQVTDQDFGRAMAGDAIDLATTALLEELVDFFPLGKRRLLQKAVAKLKDWESKALTAAERKLDSPELEAQFERALTSMSGSSGGSPVSLA